MGNSPRSLKKVLQEGQNARALRLALPFDDGPTSELLVNKLDATEGLSRDVEFTAELLSNNAFLSLRKDCFLLHNATFHDQTSSIFRDYLAHPDWNFRRYWEDLAMTYACQFNESDYNYLSRRWKAAGWYVNVERPTILEQGKVPRKEVYEYAGAYGFKDRGDDERQATLRIEEIEHAGELFEGAGTGMEKKYVVRHGDKCDMNLAGQA